MKKIFIDPGHGGNDTGAIGNGLKEKEMNLLISNKVVEKLKSYKCEVLTSRTTDNAVSLDDRCKLSNTKGSTCFISIHCNSFSSASANGFETYSYDGNSDLQKSIHSSLRENIKLTDRGRKKGNFAVLRNTKCKAVVIETGFLSNKNDSVYVKDNIDLFASAIVKGIVKHYNITVKSHTHCECITAK